MKTSNGSQTRERQAVIGPPLAPGHLSILYTVYTAISDWLASRNTQVTSQRNETLRAVCTFSLFLNCVFFFARPSFSFWDSVALVKISRPKPLVTMGHLSRFFWKLQGKWIQALGAVISGIFWLDKRWLWLVDGVQSNHYSFTSKACLPKQSQKSLRRKHVTIPVMVSGMGNWACGS